MAPLGARIVIAAAWLAAAYLFRNQLWPRWLFSVGGVLWVSWYLGPLGFGSLQRALDLPNPQMAEVPFLGYLAGFVLGPLAAVLLGYYGTKSIWCYSLNQVITCGFLFWMRFGFLDG